MCEDKLNKSIEIFDNFMNIAIDKLGGVDFNIVELMTAYNHIKNVLSQVNKVGD